jgi:hypothetical protein
MTDGNERQHFVVSGARQEHRLFEDGQSIITAANEDPASLSKLDALLISLEYQKADTVLQLSDLFTQRRLSDLQSVGGTPEVEFFGKSYSSELKSNLRWRQ